MAIAPQPDHNKKNTSHVRFLASGRAWLAEPGQPKTRKEETEAHVPEAIVHPTSSKASLKM
jgi:hypothetical protein